MKRVNIREQEATHRFDFVNREGQKVETIKAKSNISLAQNTRVANIHLVFARQ